MRNQAAKFSIATRGTQKNVNSLENLSDVNITNTVDMHTKKVGELNESVKCEHGELETRISDLENHLENAVKNLKMLKCQFSEKEGIIEDLDRKLNELINECSLKTTSMPRRLQSIGHIC